MHIRIETPQGLLDRPLDVPEGSLRLSQLARVVMALSDGGSEMAVQHARAASRASSCCSGCGVCCRQLVTLSPAEAWLLAEYIESRPDPERQEILDRFGRIEARLRAAGLIDPLNHLDAPTLSEADHYALAHDYFQLGMPCPFLDGTNACTIYPLRPSICREYLVSSPPAWCADPFNHPIERLPNAMLIGDALASLCAQRMKTEIQKIPLALAPSWARKHPEDPEWVWDGPHLVNQFLLHLEVAIGAEE